MYNQLFISFTHIIVNCPTFPYAQLDPPSLQRSRRTTRNRVEQREESVGDRVSLVHHRDVCAQLRILRV